MTVPSDPGAARSRLIEILQSAHAGERGAINAYRGHAASVRREEERRRIEEISAEEADHRERVGRILAALGAGPDPAKERKMAAIGATIGLLCRVGGWFVPNYGAGRLESANIREYEDAARCAAACGKHEFTGDILDMAEVEWEHERYFREIIEGHPLRPLFPRWTVPPPKAAIRASFETFRARLSAPARIE